MIRLCRSLHMRRCLRRFVYVLVIVSLAFMLSLFTAWRRMTSEDEVNFDEHALFITSSNNEYKYDTTPKLITTIVQRTSSINIYKNKHVNPIQEIVIKRQATHLNSSLAFPGILNYLPHLVQHVDFLEPLRAANISDARRRHKKPLFAIGIPTVSREKRSYLVDTLKSILDGLKNDDSDKIVIIVYIGEKDLKRVVEVMDDVRNNFTKELEGGLIEVIAPPAVYYPDLENLPSTFGDTKERVKWRAKQNMDYAYLMMYAQRKADYYLQLEDDVIAVPGYISKIEAFTRNRAPDWFMLEFCRLGFIGKLFHSKDLAMLVEFFLMFYKLKPNDWLLDHYIEVRVCSPEKGRKECNAQKKRISVNSRPSLFQHVGKESSLKGKIQKLIDRGFAANKKQKGHNGDKQFVPHPENAQAEVITNAVEYSRYKIKTAYVGHNFAWIKTPSNTTFISFRFTKPVALKSFLFQTGNEDHPGDILKGGRVEILSSKTLKRLSEVSQLDDNSHISSKEYISLADFNEKGVAKGNIPTTLGELVEMRIIVTASDMNNWVIFSEFLIK